MATESADELMLKALSNVEELCGLDEAILEYLSSVLTQHEEIDAGTDGIDEIVESISPFLVSYEIVEDEDDGDALARRIVQILIEKGAISSGTKELPGTNDLADVKLRQARLKERDSVAFMGSGASADTWQLSNLANKHAANTSITSISDVLEVSKITHSSGKQKTGAKKSSTSRESSIRNEEPTVSSSAAIKGRQAENATGVQINGISISVGSGLMLLDNAELKIACGRKYGLVGKNGCGKSTLLNAISRGLLNGFPPNFSVVHLEQEIDGNDITVLNFLLKSDRQLEKLRLQEKQLNDLISCGEATAEDNDKLKKCYDDLVAIDADSAEPRARKLLAGLGFNEEMQSRPTKSLSGGQRMRVALATALFQPSDLLLLDEPTNHLDIPSVVFLENYLQTCNNTFILVSHDRLFLDNVVTDVIHAENRSLIYYRGDFSNFVRVRAENRKRQQSAYESQQLQRQHMQKFVDKFRYNAKRASLAQSRLKALNRMELVEEVTDDPEVRFWIPEPSSVSGNLLELHDVSFGYPAENGSKVSMLFENANFGLDFGSHVVLLGANGCGKSTLLKIMMQQLDPVCGSTRLNPNARIGYFSQHHVDHLDQKLCPLDHLLQEFPGSKPDKVRSHLARYGITADIATRTIELLSGGQKSRVAFSKVTWNNPNLLICDEPSNHLDLETSYAVSLALKVFPGSVITVTHDQFLIEMIGDMLWVLENGELCRFHGDFSKYKKETLEKFK